MFAAASSPDSGIARELSSARARLESQERQIRELNHRIANSLQLAADLLTFEQLRSRDPKAQAALEASRARLVAVGELHRYLHGHADQPSVELKPFLSGLCEALGATTGLICTLQCDLVSVPGDTAQQLAIAINEFAINAAKHAYAGKVGGLFHIGARREGRELVVTVSDNGQGLGDPTVRHSGLGMTIVAAIVRDLKGSLTAGSEGGARFVIRLPLAAPVMERSFQNWRID